MKNKIIGIMCFIFLLSTGLKAESNEVKELCKFKFNTAHKACKNLEKEQSIYELLVMSDFEDDKWSIYEYGYWNGQRQAYLKVLALINDSIESDIFR